MNTKDSFQIVVDRLGQEGIEYVEQGGDPFIRVSPDRLLDAATLFRDDPRLHCEQLQLLSGVDTGSEMWVVYHLFSFKHRFIPVLKVVLPRNHPSVASVSSIWPAANWHERETYDLFGIHFEGHPDLRRILMTEDWQGHPLRKDYPMPGQP